MRYFLILFLALYSTSLLAQEARLIGQVTHLETGRALSGAVITLGDKEAISDATGAYEIRGLAAAQALLEVRLDGFRRQSFRVRLEADKAVVENIRLSPLEGDLDEMIIMGRAERTDLSGSITATYLGREEIRRAPGTAGDIFRGLNILPGVQSTGEFSNFSVRGRGPRDNLIYLDGIPYDRLVHFDQSLGNEDDLAGGGRFSIFGQNVVEGAEFSAGGWSSAYGGTNGSLLKLSLADGNREDAFTSIKLDLAGSELLYDGPLPGSEDSGLMVSSRYYNFGQLFKLIGVKDLGSPKLFDLLVKTTTPLNDRHRLSLLFVYTPEWFTRDAQNALASENYEDMLLIDTEQQAGLLGVSLDSLVGSSGRLQNRLYYRFADEVTAVGEAYPERSPLPISLDNLVMEEDVLHQDEQENLFGWRSDYSQQNGWGLFAIGAEVQHLSANYGRRVSRPYAIYEFDANDYRPDISQKYLILDPSYYNAVLDEGALRLSAYVEQRFDWGAVQLTPGIRVHHDALVNYEGVSPRLQMGWQANDSLRFSFTAGRFEQAPRLLDVANDSQNINLTYERSDQLSLGMDYYVGDSYKFLAEVYYQDLSRLILEGDRARGTLSNDGSGFTAGFDLALTKRFSDQWSAVARYSYAHAKRRVAAAAPWQPAEFSRPHWAGLTVNYEWNDQWALAVQYHYATGLPSDDFVIHENVFDDPAFIRASREVVARNTGRNKSFQTLNMRLDYRHDFGPVTLIAFLDVVNVLARQNVDGVQFSPRTAKLLDSGLTTFPQLGITLEF